MPVSPGIKNAMLYIGLILLGIFSFILLAVWIVIIWKGLKK